MTYDKIAEWYEAYFSDEEFVAEDMKYMNQFAEHWGESIDDLGCGSGLLVDRLPIAPTKYVGVDISQSMLDIAKRKPPNHTWVHQDIVDFQPIGQYAVSMYGSLSYVHPEQVKALLDQYQGYFVMLYADHYYPVTHKKWHLETPFYKASEYALEGSWYVNKKYVVIKK